MLNVEEARLDVFDGTSVGWNDYRSVAEIVGIYHHKLRSRSWNEAQRLKTETRVRFLSR